MLIPTLTTERLTLRAPVPADLPVFTEFRMSERSRTVGGPFTEDQAFHQFCGIFGHWNVRGYGRWIVADGETDAPLGIVGPFHPPNWPEPELAWTVFAAGEGRGVAFEAAQAARRHIYGTLGWPTLISCVAPDNARSLALARRMGCTADGQFEHPDHGILHIWRHPAPEALQ
ncbi:GNAT family N-acetyltransferase [Oceaniglobus roseus]|uniref:GNAT family N-acetyltransferase n=1 Tax=Oceaniglobus roseus TaxID=1737570 RepID=UPI0015623F68|nr:GNAT family N-acetyltransferase [Kandeliimicrobium roseum]